MDWLIFNKGPVNFRKHDEAGSRFAKLEEAMPEINDLLEAMTQDPQLRYRVLLNFHDYQKGIPLTEVEEPDDA